MRNTQVTKLWTLLGSTIAALCLAEIGLRLVVPTPVPPPQDSALKSQAMAEFDPLTGWHFKPGVHRRPPYGAGRPGHPVGNELVYSFLAGGMRKSSAEQSDQRDGRDVLLMVGGSFAQGFALTDEEALGWQLQKRLPELEVRNYATGGYGTYQSLLSLQRTLETEPPPAVALYGFIDLHEDRNVGTDEWIRTLSKDWIGKDLFLPYVSVDPNGELVHQGTDADAPLPLSGISAISRTIDDVLRRRAAARREVQRHEATKLLFLEMKRVCDEHGVPLVVALLKPSRNPSLNAAHVEFLERNGIVAVACDAPIPSERRVPGEGHPNGEHNAYWTDCVAPTLEAQLRR
jgi:hypothetical protein